MEDASRPPLLVRVKRQVGSCGRVRVFPYSRGWSHGFSIVIKHTVVIKTGHLGVGGMNAPQAFQTLRTGKYYTLHVNCGQWVFHGCFHFHANGFLELCRICFLAFVVVVVVEDTDCKPFWTSCHSCHCFWKAFRCGASSGNPGGGAILGSKRSLDVDTLRSDKIIYPPGN